VNVFDQNLGMLHMSVPYFIVVSSYAVLEHSRLRGFERSYSSLARYAGFCEIT